MFPLSIALFALALITALFGFGDGPATFMALTCVILSIMAMTAYWRTREHHT